MRGVKGFCSPILSSVLVSLMLSTSTFAEESAVYLWQKERLFAPSEGLLKEEKEKQKIFIYEGLTLEDVEKALSQHFDRVEHMMFVETLLPPTAAGVPQKEDDGCE